MLAGGQLCSRNPHSEAAATNPSANGALKPCMFERTATAAQQITPIVPASPSNPSTRLITLEQATSQKIVNTAPSRPSAICVSNT